MEVLLVVVVAVIFVITVGLISITWNVAKGGTDLLDMLGGRRGAGYTRNDISGEGKPPKKNRKWNREGGLK